jgi:hypothetical protein
MVLRVFLKYQRKNTKQQLLLLSIASTQESHWSMAENLLSKIEPFLKS